MMVRSINLNGDWLNIIKSELTETGYDFAGLPDDEISILYYTLKKRLIPSRQRIIEKSNSFACPVELQPGLELLERKISAGEDLKPHLSRKLKCLRETDELLFDWGIFHLHLGSELESDGFIRRTKPVLYARFDDSKAYFINVLNHGAWAMQELLKIIHNNWPESIEQYRLKGVLGVERKFQDNEIKELRSVQINTLIELERGVVYMGPGGGMSASGDSMQSVMEHNRRIGGLEQLEKRLTEDTEPLLLSLFGSVDFITNPELEFQLVRGHGRFKIYEHNNDFDIQLGEDKQQSG
jgi:hypothetical protein